MVGVEMWRFGSLLLCIYGLRLSCRPGKLCLVPSVLHRWSFYDKTQMYGKHNSQETQHGTNKVRFLPADGFVHVCHEVSFCPLKSLIISVECLSSFSNIYVYSKLIQNPCSVCICWMICQKVSLIDNVHIWCHELNYKIYNSSASDKVLNE